MAGLSRRFDYLVPERWSAQVRVGTRVRINLNGRRVGGWVVDDDVEPPPGVELRPLAGVSGFGPPPDLLPLAEWAAWRWAGPLSTMLGAASPYRNVMALPPVPVPSTATPAPAGTPTVTGTLPDDPAVAMALAALDRHAAGHPGPSTLRLPPDHDLLPLVETVLSSSPPSGSSARAGADAPEAGVLVLVPNLGWAGRLSARLARRGWSVAPDWASARAGWPVVVGTRGAAWAPLPALIAVVVLDSHDESYRSEGAPTVDSVRVTVERAARAGVPCLLVSPCPTLEHLALVTGEPITAPVAVERRGWPVLQVVDRRAADPRTGMLSDELVRAARTALDLSPTSDGTVPVVCVLNRTGRARLLACASCGELARCERCGRSVEQHEDKLSCPGCARQRPLLCAHCGSTRLKILRPGVSRLREELEALLGLAVAEVSGPKRRLRADESEPELPDAPVLIGTEAVLHRVRRARLVVFLDFDQHLLAQRYAAAEESMALLARAARMVGGRDRHNGAVLAQTRLPDHVVLTAAVHGDPARVSVEERPLRAELRLPPFAALATVSGPASSEYASGLREAGLDGLEVVEVDADRFLIRTSTQEELADALTGVPRPRGKVRVAVDPIDL